MLHLGPNVKHNLISDFQAPRKVSRALIHLFVYALAVAPVAANSQTIRWYCFDEKADSKGWGWSKGDDWEEIRMDDRRRFLLTAKSPVKVERKDTQSGRIYIERRLYVDSAGNKWDYSSWDAHPVFKTKNTTIYCYP